MNEIGMLDYGDGFFECMGQGPEIHDEIVQVDGEQRPRIFSPDRGIGPRLGKFVVGITSETTLHGFCKSSDGR